MANSYHIAQVNIGRMKARLEDPIGSDWPVLTTMTRYEHWRSIISMWINELSDEEAKAICYDTTVAA